MSTTNTTRQNTNFERGFKTWAENIAVSVRERMGLDKIAPLEPDALAAYMGVRVLDIQKLPLSQSAMSYLCSPDGDEWSAVTIRFDDRDAVVVNPSHGLARRSSDLVHELSHLLRKHKPAHIFVSPYADIWLRTYDPVQEDEANWLAGCLLLPRPSLLYCLSLKWDDEAICSHYNVSSALLRFRRNVSGVERQLRPRRY